MNVLLGQKSFLCEPFPGGVNAPLATPNTNEPRKPLPGRNLKFPAPAEETADQVPDCSHDLARTFMAKERSKHSARDRYRSLLAGPELTREKIPEVESSAGCSMLVSLTAEDLHVAHECARSTRARVERTSFASSSALEMHLPLCGASPGALFVRGKPDAKRKKAYRARFSRGAYVCELAYGDKHVAARDRCFDPLPANTRAAFELESSTKNPVRCADSDLDRVGIGWYVLRCDGPLSESLSLPGKRYANRESDFPFQRQVAFSFCAALR